jgi:hypothetical protein
VGEDRYRKAGDLRHVAEAKRIQHPNSAKTFRCSKVPKFRILKEEKGYFYRK